MQSQYFAAKLHVRRSLVLLFLLTVTVLCGRMTVHAAAEEKAQDIITKCKISASHHNNEFANLWNDKDGGVFSAYGEGEQFINADLNGNAAGGIYIKWANNPPVWRLEATLNDGRKVVSEQGGLGYLQEYVELPANVLSFRMVTDDGKKHPLDIVEMEIFSPGVLPGRVHIWKPTPSTAEVMMIATHQDDEILYFGGAIPYYAAEREYDTIIAYLAFDNSLRLHEALEGLWTCGVRQHPIFFDYPDKYCSSIGRARSIWNESEVTRDIVELLVRYRPQVVISQDINGEYGHGQHLLMVHCLRGALVYAEDAAYVAANLPEYQPWTVSKCYLHLYWNNRITMQWADIRLDSAGGKTALQVAREAYRCHVSQQKFGYEVGVTQKTYDCRKFGLYWTKVGEDVNKNDFFENIVPRYSHTEPAETPPEWMKRTDLKGWHYYVTDDRWSASRYLRYCTVGGVDGWYESDYTGCLTEPVRQVELIIDDRSIDLSDYETLTLVSESPRVYSYNNGILIKDMLVRYGSLAGEEPGFYVVENDNGSLRRPYQRIRVSTAAMQELKLPRLTLKDRGSMDAGKYAIIILSCVLVLVAFALSVNVFHMISVNKRRSRADYRRYHHGRDRRYR